ncbi:hypothetical protein [Streptomyces boluensis]|uniref:Uncharacterized protein n=1 Tax=Streptomyces boluensis TaxID=1775135 RepID=A0A964USI8_9ACTN|nr:hypothetical protein [Streptomyces boluensis]NBE53671.1 hypothetical protein [Streptomyces boluensis]
MAEKAPQGPPPGPRKGRPDIRVATVILLVGRELDVTDKVMLAAFETALVESGMENLNYGDRDSLGVFQQRPSQGWGEAVQVMNVNYAAHKFFEKAIPIAREETSLSAGQLAQRVQVSAFPDRYDQREKAAKGWIERAADAVKGEKPPGRKEARRKSKEPESEDPPPADKLREIAGVIGDLARRFDVVARQALPETAVAAESLGKPTAFKLDQDLSRAVDVWGDDINAHVKECRRLEKALLDLAEGE